MTDQNTLLDFEKSRNKINKRCRKCKNEYEAKRKKFKRLNPGKPFDPLWRPPKWKKCKKGFHNMTPENTIIIGYDKRCRKCYNAYKRAYNKKWETWRIYQ